MRLKAPQINTVKLELFKVTPNVVIPPAGKCLFSFENVWLNH